MPRSARKSFLETRTARSRVAIRRAPYFVKIAKGLRLGYYRGSSAGSWIARRYRGVGVYDTQALGAADDLVEANASDVFDFWQAQEMARRWSERQLLDGEGSRRVGPYRVADAVADR